MNLERFLNYHTEDFLLDDDFLQWVKHPEGESDLFWTKFLEKYPDKKKQIEDAIFILKALQPFEPEISDDRINHIKSSIKFKNISYKRFDFIFLKAAAIIIFLIILGGMVYYFSDLKESFPVEIADKDDMDKGKIILADGTIKEFDTEQTNIIHTDNGAIAVNNDTITKDINISGISKASMNKVIIPYGKRSEIRLSDGTHIWLNSGSQLFYPITFNDNIREVYLSGEAFFDVKSDPAKPFFVITNDIKIKVSGTRFNISSYENDQITFAVLISGKISAGKNKKLSREIELLPGDRLSFTKTDETIIKDKVDVELFSSWINGYLIFRSEPLSEIFKKLERFYNKKIIMEKEFDNVTFSGKLDLSENIDKVLENISFSTFFSVHTDNDFYFIKP